MSTKDIAGGVALLMLVPAALAVRAQDTAHAIQSFSIRLPFESKVVKDAPYSAESITESVQTLSDGNRIIQRSTGRVFRDGDGRVRREEDRQAGTAATVSITDPVANVSYTLDPGSHTAWQGPALGGFHIAGNAGIPVPPPMPDGLPAPNLLPPMPLPKGNVMFLTRRLDGIAGDAAYERQSEEKLPERTMEGVTVQGVRRTMTIAAGAIGNEQPITVVSEEWFAPALQVLVQTEHTDPRFGTSSYRLTNIVRVEPDRSLFEVPADYTVQKNDLIRKALPALRER